MFDMLSVENERLKGEKEQIKQEYAQQLQTEKEEYAQQLQMEKDEFAQQLQTLREDQQKQVEQQINLLKEQMTTTSEKILMQRSQQLSQTNQEQLAAILNPLRTEINQMKETVDKSGREHATSMERLDASIKANMEKASMLSERADRLANALTGQNKTQGDFGELRLRQLLEDMGLEEGVQFEEQTTMKDSNGRVIYDEEDGSRMIPDVILHFPDHRDVIIDSKMSFTAYVDYQNAQTDEERKAALDRHVASVRQHVNELSRKNYSKYLKTDSSKLDFVVMYIFQESALQLALASAPTLWKEAYDNGVVISGSQNLYMMLRVLEMTWKQVRQVENQQKIVEAANSVIDRVQLFYERFLKVDEMLERTRAAFNDVKTVTASSGQSITVAAGKLLKYGATENPKRKARLPKEEEDDEKLIIEN
ncbi:MAG: DNA recombination protein RmuC [Bacteroidaceae bacterium]|nr:DNA recombination protein RmuC [Bacteroidaceae bacterium]